MAAGRPNSDSMWTGQSRPAEKGARRFDFWRHFLRKSGLASSAQIFWQLRTGSLDTDNGIISSGNVDDISRSAASSDCAGACRELLFDCEREMKKHCIQVFNLKLTLDMHDWLHFKNLNTTWNHD
jgi:hypothetical protein